MHESRSGKNQTDPPCERVDRRVMMTERTKKQEGHREQQWKGDTQPKQERVEGVMTRSAQDRGDDRGGKRLRSSPRGSSLASVILGPFTQSSLLQGFPSPHGHHYKMEQLHLIRLQRVS